MKYEFQVFAFFLSLAATVLVGCSGIVPCDNQMNLPADIEAVVNPKPIRRDFLLNNNSHKVLIAVVDTGINYNHPALFDNIHFSLDPQHQTFRLGWDFIGKDEWPCPYLGRRSAVSDFELDLIDKLIDTDKALGIFLQKRRNVVQEHLASVWHGTSVAGLIVQGNKDIGLLAYRVIPPDTGPPAGGNYAIQIMKTILDASRSALDDGAHIIVMTTSFHFEERNDPDIFPKVRRIKDTFEQLIHCHPSVLFVTSAGNGHGYRFSGRSYNQIDFPAGIVAENLLVVGSLSEGGRISSFSNIPVNEIKAAFFPGEIQLCIFPRHMLSIPEKYLAALPSLLDNLIEGNDIHPLCNFDY